MALTICRQRRLIYSLFVFSILRNAHAAEPVEFPLPPYVDAICIPVELGGSEHLFLLDSGASTLLFDESLKEHLGEPAGQYQMRDAAGKRVKMEFFQAPQLRIRGADWTCSEKTGCFDFSSIQGITGRRIEGVLGVPFFASHIIQFDFDRRRVTILAPDTPRQDDWGTPIQMRLADDHLPMIPLDLPEFGIEWCVIDTGFNGSLSFHWATCLELEKTGTYAPRPDRLRRMLSGDRWVRNGIISRVSLQDFNQSHLTADCSKIWSCVGLHYLKRFRVTIDAGRQVAYFVKGEAFDDPEELPIGFSCTRVGEKTLIAGIQRGCPGEQAGLRDADELRSVNGQPVSGMSTNEIRWTVRKLSQKGTNPVGLTIRRDGRVLKLQIDLSSIYE